MNSKTFELLLNESPAYESFPEKYLLGGVLFRATLDLHATDPKHIRDAIDWFKQKETLYSFDIMQCGVTFQLIKETFQLTGWQVNMLMGMVKEAEESLKNPVKQVSVKKFKHYHHIDRKLNIKYKKRERVH